MKLRELIRLAVVKPGEYRLYSIDGKYSQTIGTSEAMTALGNEMHDIATIWECDSPLYDEITKAAGHLAWDVSDMSEIKQLLSTMLDVLCRINPLQTRAYARLEESYEDCGYSLPDNLQMSAIADTMAVFIRELTRRNTATTITPLMEFFSKDVLTIFREFPVGPLSVILYGPLEQMVHDTRESCSIPDREFWDAPPDKWNYLSEYEPDCVGIRKPSDNPSERLYNKKRTPDPFNLSVYYARLYRKLKPEYTGDFADKLIDAFRTYSMAIHRTTEVFEDTLSVRVEGLGRNKEAYIPDTANTLKLKDAIDMLESIDLELCGSLAYVVLKALAEVSSPKKAHALCLKRRRVVFDMPARSTWYDFFQTRPYGSIRYNRKKGVIIGSIISAAIALFWIPLVFSPQFRQGVKEFFTVAGIIGVVVLIGLILGPGGGATRSSGSSSNRDSYWEGYSDAVATQQNKSRF